MKNFLVQTRYESEQITVRARMFFIRESSVEHRTLVFSSQERGAIPLDASKEVAWFNYDDVVFWRIAP